MKKIFLIFLLSTYILSCHSQPQIKTIVNDANAEKRDIAPFTAIQVSSAITVYLSQGNEDAIAVSCSDMTKISKIITEVKNGVLKISLDNDFWNSWRMGDLKVKAYISVKTLNSLKASGASSIKINETISGTNLNVEASGASNIKGNLIFNTINANVSGASSINITGKTNEAVFDASGASSIKGFDFITTNCKIEASGASNVNLTVNGSLVAEASGASSIKYAGNPTSTNVDATGASSIKKKAD